MPKFTLIHIEYNSYNGFFIELFSFENSNSLFGVGISKDFVYVDLFYYNILIFEK